MLNNCLFLFILGCCLITLGFITTHILWWIGLFVALWLPVSIAGIVFESWLESKIQQLKEWVYSE